MNVSVSKNGKVFIQNETGAGIWLTVTEIDKLVAEWPAQKEEFGRTGESRKLSRG